MRDTVPPRVALKAKVESSRCMWDSCFFVTITATEMTFFTWLKKLHF